MKTRMLLVLCLLCVTGAFAQTVSFTDVSDQGNPFTLSGSVSLANSVADFAVKGKNVSSKEILAYRVELSKISVQDHDYYFKPHGIQAGTEAGVVTPSSLPAVSGILENPQVRTVYVQFADGSSWGDQQVGAAIQAKRPLLCNSLNNWFTAYENQGEPAFLRALNQETAFKGVAEWVLYVQSTSGTPAAVIQVKTRLDSAAAIKAAGVN